MINDNLVRAILRCAIIFTIGFTAGLVGFSILIRSFIGG